MYPLFALAAGLIRCLHINRFYKLSEGVWREFCEVGVSACPLNKLFKVVYLSFLYFDFSFLIHFDFCDVRFVDVDGNGIIDANDRTDIGKGMPDWTFGFNLGVSWKNFDLNMMWQGTAGNDIYDATRRTDIATSNLPSWMLNRWTGEGTSNRIPRFVQGDNVNWQSSDLYVYDGSYLRLKNIQLGYTLPAALTQKVFISSLRFYVAAENLFTFTKYHGFDPEISSGGTSLGIDYGVYPQARVWTIGASLSF